MQHKQSNVNHKSTQPVPLTNVNWKNVSKTSATPHSPSSLPTVHHLAISSIQNAWKFHVVGVIHNNSCSVTNFLGVTSVVVVVAILYLDLVDRSATVTKEVIIENNVNFMLVDRCFYMVFVVSKFRRVLLLNVNPRVKLVRYNATYFYDIFVNIFSCRSYGIKTRKLKSWAQFFEGAMNQFDLSRDSIKFHWITYFTLLYFALVSTNMWYLVNDWLNWLPCT